MPPSVTKSAQPTGVQPGTWAEPRAVTRGLSRLDKSINQYAHTTPLSAHISEWYVHTDFVKTGLGRIGRQGVPHPEGAGQVGEQ